jgi:hypothetical protein
MNAHSKILTPAADVISAFIYALFPPKFVHAFPDAWIEIVCMRPDGKLTWRFFAAHDLKPAIDYVVKMNTQDWNCYVSAALRHGEKPAPGERASKRHFCAASHFWVDCDDPGCYERAVEICERGGPTPAMGHITGTVPHQRGQLWFECAQPVTDPAELEAANTALRDTFNGDKVQNADRIMRIPGTVSFPPPHKTERGYSVELTTLQVARDAPTYTAEALCDLGPITKPTNAATDASPRGKSYAGADRFQLFADSMASEVGRLTDADMQALLEKHANGTGAGWHDDLRAVTWELLCRDYEPFAIQMVIGSACKKGFEDPDIGRLVNKKWDEFQAERRRAECDAVSAETAAPLQRFLTLEQWRERDLPKPDYLLGEVFSTTNRGIMSAPTGLGKTNFALALGMRIAAGANFLHWEGRRACKVLYIDGEMSRRLLKQRLTAEEARLIAELGEQVREQFKPCGFHALSTEDIPNFQPLNARQGQAAVEKIIAEMGWLRFRHF